ncbi:MAG: hypothetical protein JSW64_12075 [Candidatus Zixiibacteriota bacterium]|nr:MAG: hypothetical protein JSW64_12075 [candidate division Zixibacteria bacterium]
MMGTKLERMIVIFISVVLVAPVSCGKSGVNDNSALLVPFNIDRNRVIIPTSVNGSRELNLILDTGMAFDGVYLFHEEFVDEIDTSGAIEVRVPGAGDGEASTAVMIETGRIAFGDVTIDSQKVIISRSPHTQNFPTDGVIGWNLFGHYAVEIDYDKEIITLHDSLGLGDDDSWSVIPIELKKGIPFLECEVEVVKDERVLMIFYIDLASGDALELLTGPDQKFTMPDSLMDQYLGTGLSGDIHGQSGKSVAVRISMYELRNITTAFAPAEVRSKQEGADGILGNDLIRRFNVIFDYSNARLYLKPNGFYETPFE